MWLADRNYVLFDCERERLAFGDKCRNSNEIGSVGGVRPFEILTGNVRVKNWLEVYATITKAP